MNTNKIVHNKQHQQSTILTNSPPTHPSNPHPHHHHQQQHYQDMIKTSFPPSVTPHSYVDISPPSASSTLHASGVHLPSLSHHYDTSSVPSSLDMTTTTNNTRRSMTTPLDYNNNSYHQDSMQSHHHHVKREIHEQVHVNNHHHHHLHQHQHRYHPYQRSPVSPPPHGGHVIRGGMELHNCNPSADAGSSNGSNSGLPMHVSYQQHHHRTSPTKKSPISSDNHMQMANHDIHTVQQAITSNNRKKIPNRSSYETHVFMNAPAASVNNPSTSSQQPQKRKNVISKQEMIKVLHLPQTQASSILGCSLSTLKRRFYELKEELEMEKWPQFYHEIRHLPIFSKVYPMSLYFMLNHEGCNDMHKPLTRQHLENAHEMYEQSFEENTNHFLLYCKTTSR